MCQEVCTGGRINYNFQYYQLFCFSGDTHGQHEVIVDRLMELLKKLQVTITDYQILSQMLISFFKNLAEVSIIFNLKLL